MMLSSLFTHPWLLAALAAVTIPLIIELLFRLHRRRVELPTIRWLLKHKDQKKIKRQDRLLLIIRSAAIFLLVLAVARPLVGKRFFGGVRDRHVTVLLDGTTSMGQASGTGTAFDLARQQAETLIRGLTDGTTVTVGVVADRLHTPVAPTKDLRGAADTVHGLRLKGGPAPITDGLEWAKTQLARDARATNETYVLSDFARSTWLANALAGQLLQDLAKQGDVVLIDCARERCFNVAFARFEPVEPIASVGQPVEFRGTLRAYGRPSGGADGATSVALTFLVDGQKKDLTVLDLPPQRAAPATRPGAVIPDTFSFSFKHVFSKPGEYLVSVEASGDDNPLDNRRQYLITVPDEHRVLLFDPTAPMMTGGLPEPGRAAANDRQRKSFYLAEAVAPQVPPGEDKTTHFSATVRHPVDAERENLGAYGAVCLVGLDEIPEVLARNCEVYVRDGGSLLIFLDEGVNRFDYRRKLARDADGLMPVLLEAPASAGEGAADTLRLDLVDAPHPALAYFAGERALLGAAGAPRVDRYMPFAVLPEAKGHIRVMATFSNGEPAIVERLLGQGRVCLFDFTADSRWSDFVALTQFLPLVQETLRYLVGNPDRSVNLDVGQDYRQPVLKTSQHLLVVQPDGSKVRVTPRARRTTTAAPAKMGSDPDEKTSRGQPPLPPAADAAFAGWEVTFTPEQQGLYRVEATRGEVRRARFVANAPAAEGDPSRLALSDARSAFGGVLFDWVPPTESTAELVARRYGVTEAAVILLILLAALLALESLLAALWGRRRGLRGAVSTQPSAVSRRS
jgi:hypothetical protein